MKLYLCGPMTGLENLNFPVFHAAARALRILGHEVTNPAEINADPAEGWASCMRKDIRALVDCEALALLPGWENSRGALLERHIAIKLGMQVFLVRDLVYETATDADHEVQSLGACPHCGGALMAVAA